MQFIVLEQGFEAAQLNTSTMSDIQTLMPAICWQKFPHHPAPGRARLAVPPNLKPTDWWAMAQAPSSRETGAL